MQMSVNFLKFEKRHWWQSCYVWAGCSQLLSSLIFFMLLLQFFICEYPLFVYYLNYLLLSVWIEAPLGFGLLLSCRISQAFQLYYIFVK